MKRLLSSKAINTDLAFLILRVFVGTTMLFSHGLGKMMKFFEPGDIKFANVFGMGEVPSLVLAVFAEVICAGLIAVGAYTRLASIALGITMAVAAFSIHADDPFSKKEFALLYLVPCIVLFLTGPGKYSVDQKILKR
ncbi:MAG: DoxX family protein [Flavobacteriales bacterium]